MNKKYISIFVISLLLITLFPSLNGILIRQNQHIDIQSNLNIIPNDSFFTQQWALQNTGQTGGIIDCDIDAVEAWDIEKGNSDIVIAIIDSGIDYNHPDLAENIWINKDEIPDNNIDDDQNGYIDDYMGYDFTDSDDPYPLDGNGHGTVMSGAAAAVTNNNVGIAGVAWNCKIMPVKIADENWYADVNNIAEGIRYAADNDAKVICMAFSARSSAIREAVDYAYSKGAFLCCAAGNSGNSIKQYPAAYENVTAVAATDHNDQQMDYTYDFNGVRVVSSYGTWVDIASPGQEIHTTSPTYHVVACDTWGQELNYDIISGTTLATPVLGGVAALVFSKNPNLSPDEVKEILCESVDPYDSEYYLGTGRVNAYKALTAPEKPEKPTGPANGKTGKTYTFTTKASDDEGEQVSYMWDWGDGNFSEWLGPYNSEEICETQYSWEQENNFNIRVKAKDENGGLSPWSDPLVVSMPRKKSFNPYLIFNSNSINITWNKHIIDDSFDYAFGVHASDLDKDGDCDVLGAAEDGDFIAWWRNEQGNPINWTKFIIDDDFDGATSIFAVDIDGDLDVDVVGSAWHDNEIALWRNEGGDPPNWIKYTIRSGFDFAHEVYCHDLDLDGDIDILGASTDDNQIAWWRNEGGNPISWTEQIISNNFLGAKSVRVADIDNDGLLDIIGAAILDDKIIWWRNLGGEPLVWEEYVIVDDFDGAHRAEICDLDLDGDIDIVGAAYFEREISWWSNDGGTPVTWTKQVIVSNFNGACIGLPVDIDDDGDIDVVGTAQQANDVALFRNDGGNPFVWTKIIIDPFFWGAWPGFVCDIDGDDDIDILVGASFGDKLAWWESDLSQKPFIPERPSGPTSGKPNIEYSYSSFTTDPQDDNVFYLFNWGDGNDSGWLGPFISGETCEATYTWETKGNYEIKAKARDIYGSESDWSDPLSISMPRNKLLIFTPLEQLMERFPILEHLLQRLLNL